MEKPLLIVGNKRSGSTQLMRLLNLHPNIFISNESDIIWILYQFYNNSEFLPYKWDDPKGMKATVNKYSHLLNNKKTVIENFVAIQKQIMKDGFLSLRPMEKDSLQYIGDQKPFQNIAPELLPFIIKQLPNAKFIHLIRHPFSVVQSSKNFANGTGGYIWKGMSEEELIERWTMHELWVEDAKNNYNLDIIDIRYEDLIFHTEKTLKELYAFLKLSSPDETIRESKKITKKNLKWRKRLNTPQNTAIIMRKYNYRINNPLIDYKLPAKILHYFFRLFKKIINKLAPFFLF